MACTTDQVRLLIPDVDVEEPIFSDSQLETYLEIAGDNPLRAAAYALRAIASNQALTLKWVRTDDLQVNGAEVAKQLRELAKDLDGRAEAADEALLDEGFGIVYPVQPDYFPHDYHTTRLW